MGLHRLVTVSLLDQAPTSPRPGLFGGGLVYVTSRAPRGAT